MSVMVYPCMFCVAVLMDLFGRVCYFVVECYLWTCSVLLEVLYWINHVCHQYDVCENYVGSMYIGVLSETHSVSSVNWVQSAFL